VSCRKTSQIQQNDKGRRKEDPFTINYFVHSFSTICSPSVSSKIYNVACLVVSIFDMSGLYLAV